MAKLAQALDKALTDYFQECQESPDSARNMLGSVISSTSLRLKNDQLFSMSSKRIARANRERFRKIPMSGESCRLTTTESTVAFGRAVTYLNPSPPESYASSKKVGHLPGGTMASSSDDRQFDTSRATRHDGERMGECERSVFEVESGPRVVSWRNSEVRTNVEIIGVGTQYSQNNRDYEIRCEPFSAFITDEDLIALRESEAQYCNELLQNQGYGLIKSTLPNHREMGLMRSIVELRDLPATIKQSTELALDLAKGKGRNIREIGSDYLNLEFGIKPVFDDVRKLIRITSELPKRIAYLQKRWLRNTTFRTQRKFLEGGPSVQLKLPYNPVMEPLKSVGTLNDRKVTLRCVLNCNVKLPEVDSFFPPEYNTYGKLLGLNPSLADVYALTPWTWLIDWYAGIGEYMDVLIAYNSEPSTINWGTLSAKTEVTLRTVQEHEYTAIKTLKRGSTVVQRQEIKNLIAHTGIGRLTTYKRIDCSRLPDVACTSTQTGLSNWQTSILAALFASKYF